MRICQLHVTAICTRCSTCVRQAKMANQSREVGLSVSLLHTAGRSLYRLHSRYMHCLYYVCQ